MSQADESGALLMLVDEQRVFIDQNNHTYGGKLKQPTAFGPFVGKLIPFTDIASAAYNHNIPRIIRASFAGDRNNMVGFILIIQVALAVVTFALLSLILRLQILEGIFTPYLSLAGFSLALVYGRLLSMLPFIDTGVFSGFFEMRLIVIPPPLRNQIRVSKRVLFGALFFSVYLVEVVFMPIDRVLFEIPFVIGELALLALFVQNTLSLISIEEKFRGSRIAVGAFGALHHRGVWGYSVHAVRPQFLSSRLWGVSALAEANIITPALYHISSFKNSKGGFYA